MTIPEALHLAAQHQQAARWPEAEQLFRAVLAQEPQNAIALYNLGLQSAQQGKFDAAVEFIGKAVAVQPNDATAWHNLGAAQERRGRLDDAITAYQTALRLNGVYPQGHNDLGVALGKRGRLDEALRSLQRTVELNPAFATAHHNLGIALQSLKRFDEAEAAVQRAITLQPALPEAWRTLGRIHRDVGRDEQAIAAWRKAISLKPDYADPHGDLAIALLRRGQFEDGWAEYEWRWKCSDFPTKKREFGKPLWAGANPAGKTILLYSEQGFGDAIQFIRYAPLIADMGARVMVQCQPSLRSLLDGVRGVVSVYLDGEPLPSFDWQAPLMSLPFALRTTLATVPRDIPYIVPEPSRMQSWSKRLGMDVPNRPPMLRVGLAWAGRAEHSNDRQRSMPLAALAPLASVPNVTFYSLQKGEAGKQARRPPEGMSLADFTGSMYEFADTAACIASLDLVIGVDTAVVHLAGAMGKPVWTLLPQPAEWRWLEGRDDSPWYPTMRLFRQDATGNWAGVVARVKQALMEMREGNV